MDSGLNIKSSSNLVGKFSGKSFNLDESQKSLFNCKKIKKNII